LVIFLNLFVFCLCAGTLPSKFQKEFLTSNPGIPWAWGFNYHGQLGNGHFGYSNVPVQVLDLTNVITVAGGGEHSLALKNDGTVWAWGDNYEGQLGNGTNSHSNVPVQVLNLSNVVAISGGWDHSFALKQDGTVWAWGFNYYGQLGNGTNTSSTVPVQVLNLTGVIAIAGGGNHSLAISPMGGVPKVVPDGSNGTEPLKVLKNNSEGSQLQVIWDDQCLSLKTNIIYGDLSQVSSYQISGSKCNISNPDIWDIGSTTNIWFIIVSDNGAGVESSWGESSFGQRNGENASGECGNNLRDNSGTCP